MPGIYVKSSKPNNCLEKNPTQQTVLFSGCFISLTKVHHASGIGIAYLSRIFAGQRYPSLKTAKLLAHALRMSLDTFVRALDNHRELVLPYLDSTSTEDDGDQPVDPKEAA